MSVPTSYKPVQDVAPAKGFGYIEHRRTVPKYRGPPSWFAISALVGIIGYGIYGDFKTKQQKRKDSNLQRQIEMCMIGCLQSESDIQMVERLKIALAREKHLMKHVPGWIAGESTYHDKTFYSEPLYFQKKL